MTEMCKVKCQSVTKYESGNQEIALSLLSGANGVASLKLIGASGEISWTNPPIVFEPGRTYSIQVVVVK